MRRYIFLIWGILFLALAGCSPHIQSYKIRFKAPKRAASSAESPERKVQHVVRREHSLPVIENETLTESPEPAPMEKFCYLSGILALCGPSGLLVGMMIPFIGIGLVLLGFLALPASVAFGILGLSKLRKSTEKLRGKGFAIFGIVFSSLLLLAIISLMVALSGLSFGF